MGQLETDFAANREHLARTRALNEVMNEEIERREALGITASHPDARIFAAPAAPEDQRRRWPTDSFSQPVGFSRRVYAVGFGGKVSNYLGYEDDPECIERILGLGDHWKVVYEDVFEDSCSDEWLGRAVAEPGSPEKVAEEREAWDDYEYAKTHREEVAADRFEYRGADARSGFSDVTERQRRERNNEQLQLQLEREATVFGDERKLGSLRDRKLFRAMVEAFGEDPDDEKIRAWVGEVVGHYVYRDGRTLPERRGYKRCIRALVAKAAAENVALPKVA